MSETETWQVNAEAAEVYEREFVPAIFGEWAPRLCNAVGIKAGDTVLDVACGTGVVAREATRRGAHVTGLDLNRGMLGVARREAPQVTFERGDATDLPFPPGSFAKVLCQFALMYVPDRERALSEMTRVTRPGGVAGFAVWATLAESPGYQLLAELAERAAGAETAAILRAPFVLGDREELLALVATAGWRDVSLEPHVGAVRFPSVDEFVRAEVEGSPLADTLGVDGYEALLAEARVGMAPFCTIDGLQFPIAAHIVTTSRR